MRIAVYNQMFGLNGRKLSSFLEGHWAVHYQKNPNKIWKRTRILDTVNLIRDCNPDIIGVVEVLEGQEEELKKGLREIGYNYFYIGKGHKTKGSNLCVQEMIASKIKGEKINIGKWPLEDEMGGGGGLAHVCFSNPAFNLVFAHLGLPSKKYYLNQINFLQDYLKNLNEKTLLIGDFNLSYKNLKSYFPDFELFSDEIKTCSMTPLINLFYNKDVDHILGNGFEKIYSGSFDGRSDHKLVYADLK